MHFFRENQDLKAEINLVTKMIINNIRYNNVSKKTTETIGRQGGSD